MKTLVLDIETFPILAWSWTAYEANALRIAEDTSICAWSAKWLGGKHITKALCDYPDYKAGSRNDEKLLKDLWALLDEADVVVAHNGDRFDLKKITYRFMVHGMKPPSPFQSIDTLKAVKRVASFDRHNLGELGRTLRLGRKLATGGADLWFKCMEGDEKAWARMKRYNRQDVVLLEQVYLAIRPWMKAHPRAHNGEENCPKCGSHKLQNRGSARTTTRVYQRLQCQGCGSWLRSTKAESAAKITVA